MNKSINIFQTYYDTNHFKYLDPAFTYIDVSQNPNNDHFEIEYLNTIKRKDSKVVLRKVKYKKHPIPEYTGFVEFEDFIFFIVMFSPVELSNKNIRKMENILTTITPRRIEIKTGGNN